MTYFHDRSAMCTVGGCTACGTRWLAGDIDESRAFARGHELHVHPGQIVARDALNSATHRRRRAG